MDENIREEISGQGGSLVLIILMLRKNKTHKH